MAKITDLPVEILLRIFQFYLQTENQHKLMSVLSSVCETWKAVCLSSVLWLKFDGTVQFKTMQKLCSKGCLNNTKEMVISSTECLEDKDAKNLFSFLKNVEVINLSEVKSVSKNVFPVLAQSNMKLREIQIGYKESSEKPTVLRFPQLATFLSSKGGNLTTVKISNCTIQNFNQLLKCISENCPHLEHFNFTNNIRFRGTFPTRHFQCNCPKLKVLHLDHNLDISTTKHTLGFPCLEVFSYTDLDSLPHIRDQHTMCILFNSPNLKFLSLTNCCISVEALCLLPAHSVEYLFLCRSKIVNSITLKDIFQKWGYSLKQVDISRSNSMAVNNAMRFFTELTDVPPVEFLDLSYTQVTSNTVRRILKKCTRIKMLHLASCRNLGRGLKRNYSGRAELKELLEKLETSAYEDSTDEEMSI